MDSFKYIGDENLIFSDDEEEDDDENDKVIKEENVEIITKPMEQIFEIVLKNYVSQEYKENPPIVNNKKRKVIKNLKWLKYYI